MRLREIETRILRLERAPSNSRLGRMLKDEIDGEIIRLLNKLAEGFPTYNAMIDEVAATPEPDMPDCARQMRWFIDDYLPRRQRGEA